MPDQAGACASLLVALPQVPHGQADGNQRGLALIPTPAGAGIAAILCFIEGPTVRCNLPFCSVAAGFPSALPWPRHPPAEEWVQTQMRLQVTYISQ